MGLHIKELVEKELEQLKQNVQECLNFLDDGEVAGLDEVDLTVVAAIQNKQIIGGLARRFGLLDKHLKNREYALEVEEGQITLVQVRTKYTQLDFDILPLGFPPGCGPELWDEFMTALEQVTALDILSLDIPEIIAVEICQQSGLIENA